MQDFDYGSDLHLEFSEFPIGKVEPPAPDKILLVAGDIVLAQYLKEKRTDPAARSFKKRFIRFLESVRGYKLVVMIPGNHEAYGGDWADVLTDTNEFIKAQGIENVRMVNRKRIALTDKVDLLATTLWTDFNHANPMSMMEVNQGMNDFQICQYHGVRFQAGHALEEHQQSMNWIEDQLHDKDKEFIVMTHHLPSFQGVDPAYKGMELNYGYASDLDYWVEAHPQIKVWIHGHTHYNTDYMIGKTRILSHQRGYPPNSVGHSRSNNWIGYKWGSFSI